MEKNSEDEDGQLEEQIERLQEKVESAQSEQKNLFLVIFQVKCLDTSHFHFSLCFVACENHLRGEILFYL